MRKESGKGGLRWSVGRGAVMKEMTKGLQGAHSASEKGEKPKDSKNRVGHGSGGSRRLPWPREGRSVRKGTKSKAKKREITGFMG